MLQLSEKSQSIKKTKAADGVDPQPGLRQISSQRVMLLNHAAIFFAVAFAGERRFEAALFARWNIEGVSFHFANDVFLLHLTLEATERAFESLVVAKLDFCHSVITCLSLTAHDLRLELLKGLDNAMRRDVSNQENLQDKLLPTVSASGFRTPFKFFCSRVK
jgi:hypothetical protein